MKKSRLRQLIRLILPYDFNLEAAFIDKDDMQSGNEVLHPIHRQDDFE